MNNDHQSVIKRELGLIFLTVGIWSIIEMLVDHHIPESNLQNRIIIFSIFIILGSFLFLKEACKQAHPHRMLVSKKYDKNSQ